MKFDLRQLFVGAAQSVEQLVAEQAAKNAPKRRGNIASQCTPCAARARIEAARSKYGGGK